MRIARAAVGWGQISYNIQSLFGGSNTSNLYYITLLEGSLEFHTMKTYQNNEHITTGSTGRNTAERTSKSQRIAEEQNATAMVWTTVEKYSIEE